MWTLTIDCNPLEEKQTNKQKTKQTNKKNTAFEKTVWSYMEFTESTKNNLLMQVTAVQSAYINFPFYITLVCPSSK